MVRITILLPLLYIYTVSGAVLNAPRDEPAATPTPVVNVEPDKIATPTTTWTSLYIPVTTDPPDILGIAEISGFYGPGPWSAWVITIAASWRRIRQGSEERIDPNTWAFLLGINWAALELWRGIYDERHIPPGSLRHEPELMKRRGSIGAALNVTFWGSSHAVFQFIVIVIFLNCRCPFDYRRQTQVHRLRVLALGLISPLLALTGSAWLGDTDLLPALYYDRSDEEAHFAFLAYAASTGLAVIPIVSYVVMHASTLFADRLLSPIDCATPFIGIFVFISVTFVLILQFFADKLGDGYWIVGLQTPIFYVFFAGLGLGWAMLGFGGPGVSIFLVWMLTFFGVLVAFGADGTRTGKISESCFIMPCAPQSITDGDQLFSLFAGLCLSFLGEVYPVLWARLKKQYDERKQFFQHVEGRLEQVELRRIAKQVSDNEAGTSMYGE